LCLGGGLLALGVPRLTGAVLALEPRAVLWAVHEGEALPAARLAEAAEGLRRAVPWTGEGEQENDRGLLLLRQAEATPAGPERERLFAEAEKATEAGLARSPGHPSAWARLAALRHARGDTAGAVAALRLSMLSGSVVPALMISRLEIAFRLMPALDAETAALVERQIRLAWVIDPEPFTAMLVRPEVADTVRRALADLSDEEIRSFLRLHARH